MGMPSFFKQGLSWFATVIIATTLSVGGLLTAGALHVTGASTLASATITDATLTNATATALAVGSGKQLTTLNSAVASLDFPAIAGGQCVGQTMTVTGASTSTSALSSVVVGVPTSVINSATATAWYGYVSAPNTVTVVGCNSSSKAEPDQAAANFRATVQGFN